MLDLNNSVLMDRLRPTVPDALSPTTSSKSMDPLKLVPSTSMAGQRGTTHEACTHVLPFGGTEGVSEPATLHPNQGLNPCGWHNFKKFG